ncbi:hypothetical protein Adi01nite_04690 [Amorphoplanes digitatis]|nr:hypothetical protein GCM10020092_039500 [Actinoplanes digitatis]GID91057.1 hypothetical protein Adi01nite_04690 [Actinoplanes digitatis]
MIDGDDAELPAGKIERVHGEVLSTNVLESAEHRRGGSGPKVPAREDRGPAYGVLGTWPGFFVIDRGLDAVQRLLCTISAGQGGAFRHFHTPG